ncbi:DoxX family protein [Bordetella tumbae]|uniref:DoxX family protein n=1 Tax=Bordetella tumbae TaxID=1649139 RepID=UPI0039F14C45
MNATFSLLGRIGLALIFIISGWGKITGYAGAEQYMSAMGVSPALLPLVILLEFGGGLAIAAGLFTRWIAIAFALFSVATAVVFHANFGDAMQAINFWKNIAIAGGFLSLAAQGAGAWSLDALRGSRKA